LLRAVGWSWISVSDAPFDDMLNDNIVLFCIDKRMKRVAKVTWHVSAKNDCLATEFVAIPGHRDYLSFDMCYMWKRQLPRRDDCKKHVRDVRRDGTAGYV